MKVCRRCELELPEETFRRGRICRPCEATRARAYRATETGKLNGVQNRNTQKAKETRKRYKASPRAKYLRRLQNQRLQQDPIRKEKLRVYRSARGKTEKGKERGRRKRERVRLNPARLAKRREHLHRYRASSKGQATHARRNLRRYQAALATDHPLLSAEWGQILREHRYQCFYCKKGLKAGLTMDHVIPLAKGGRHVKENIVPACRSCNSKKGSKLILLL